MGYGGKLDKFGQKVAAVFSPLPLRVSVPVPEPVLTRVRPWALLTPVMLLLMSCGGGDAPSSAAEAASPSSESQSMSAISASDSKKLKTVISKINKAKDGIKTSGPSEFADPKNRDAMKATLGKLYDELAAIEAVGGAGKSSSEVSAAVNAYDGLKAAVKTESARWKSQAVVSADPQTGLRMVEESFAGQKVPQALQGPFTREAMEAWLGAAIPAQEAFENGAAALQSIAANAGSLPVNEPGTPQSGAGYDQQDIRRLSNYANRELQKSKSNFDSLASNLSLNLEHMEREARTLKGPYAEQGFETIAQTAEAALLFEQSAGRTGKQAQSLLATIDKARSNLAAAGQGALNEARLPKAKSKDKKRLKDAKAILAVKKYGFGKHGPIVLITEDIVTRTREEAEYEDGKLKVWIYKWDEYKFVTPIQADNGDWHLWTITAKKFASGGRKTPIGKWVSGQTSQGPQILEKSF